MIRVFLRWAMCRSMPFEGAAADEQDVLRVHVDELLLGMLAAALRRDVHHIPFQELQHRLLHALARHVAGDGRVVGLAGDLVDLVDEDDAALGLLEVEIGLLQQPGEDALDILAHIAGLGEDGGVHDGEGHVQLLGDGLRQQRLARSRGPHQQDVGLLQLHAVVGLADQVVADALVVVVHGHGEDGLGPVLADDILVQVGLDLLRLRGIVQRTDGGLPFAGRFSSSATYSAAIFAQSEQMYPSMPWSMNGTSASVRPQRTQRFWWFSRLAITWLSCTGPRPPCRRPWPPRRSSRSRGRRRRRRARWAGRNARR